MNIMSEIGALEMLGFRALPASRKRKAPIGKLGDGGKRAWGQYRNEAPTEVELLEQANNADAVCIILGKCSENSEVLDFDNAEYWEKWKGAMQSQRPDLLNRLVYEITRNGGHHVLYRCSEIQGSQALAKDSTVVDGPGEWPTGYGNKKAVAKKCGDQWVIEPVLIETRGEGALIICAPTKGYAWEDNKNYSNTPYISPEERRFMLDLARSFSKVEIHDSPEPEIKGKAPDFSKSPYPQDQYNQAADLDELKDLLYKGGWNPAGEDKTHLRFSRPGKSDGMSGTLTKDAPHIFYNFSENADLPARKGLTPFALLVAYGHNGDQQVALADLEARGFKYNLDLAAEFFSAVEGTSDSPADVLVKELNKTHALVSINGSATIIAERADGGLDLMRKSDFETFFLNRRVPIIVKDKKGNIATKCEQLSKVWLGHKDRRMSKGICFKPGGCEDGYTNLWRGFALEPCFDDYENRCAKYRWHVENIICGGDPKIIRYLWAWLADIIQKPGNKPGVAVVLKGNPGTGKGIFARPFMKILGQNRHAIQVQSRELFLGRFNGHMSDKILVFLDEAYWHGDKQTLGKLKGFITEPTINIEQKGIDSYTVDSAHRILLASNEEHVIPAALGERRFLMLNVKDDHEQDHAYFGAIVDEMQNGGNEALMAWLLEYDYTGVDLKEAPRTEALTEQKLHNLDTVTAFWLECLKCGSLSENDFTNEPWPKHIRHEDTYKRYRWYCQQRNERYPQGEEGFKATLFKPKGLCPLGGETREMIDGKRCRAYKIPTLDDCRKIFDKQIRSKMDWDKGEEFDFTS